MIIFIKYDFMKNFILLLSIIVVLFSCRNMNDDDDLFPKKRADGSILLDIPLNGSQQNAAFSPDGQSIVFTNFINGYNIDPADIYTYHINTKVLKILVSNHTGNINLPGSSWRNNKIIFASTRDPHDEIYMIDANGNPGDEILITKRVDRVAYEPSFSGNGEWCVFESHELDKETDGIIMKYKINGNSPYVALTDIGQDCRQPNWSTADNKILYQRKIGNQWNIWIMNMDGTDQVQLTTNIGNCTDASFSPDGKSIVFSSDYNSKIANIFKISIDGNQLEQLTHFDGYDGATSLSVHNTSLVFESCNGDPDESNGTKIYLLKI